MGAILAAAGGAAISPDTGELIGLKGLVAALVAGFGSPGSALAAGLVVGAIEAAASNLHVGSLRLGPGYGDVVPLVLAFAIIAVRRIALPSDELL